MKTFTAVYDLAVGPVSYDFATWLIAAEMARKREGADHLHIIIRPKPDGVDGWFRDKTALYSAGEMHWRLWHLVIPLCRLIRATVAILPPDLVPPPSWVLLTKRLGAEAGPLRPLISHHAGPIIAAARAGEAVPRFSAGEHAVRSVEALLEDPERTVTMTLRETYEPGRNAERAEWLDARDAIKAAGYEVIVVEDTSRALREGTGFYELNVELRMALYDVAALNLHCHNGSQVLSWFSDQSWMAFDAALPAEWRAHWEKYLGLKPGEQLPWAREDQRLVYEHARAEVILREFRRWAGATS